MGWPLSALWGPHLEVALAGSFLWGPRGMSGLSLRCGAPIWKSPGGLLPLGGAVRG